MQRNFTHASCLMITSLGPSWDHVCSKLVPIVGPLVAQARAHHGPMIVPSLCPSWANEWPNLAPFIVPCVAQAWAHHGPMCVLSLGPSWAHGWSNRGPSMCRWVAHHGPMCVLRSGPSWPKCGPIMGHGPLGPHHVHMYGPSLDHIMRACVWHHIGT